MYNKFFGFNERPFQLVPNPAYLFLGRSHEEAIAHLNYALSHGDGFVELSGEVGTGKTTLCRAFLDGLDDNTEVAYIFNPRLSSIELLRTINDEFGIPSDADNTKELIDTLNTFLMKIKTEGKNAILLIDEAQNLDKDVLEQLRLLSNLETNTSKLLQIILVGQPELQKMLDSYELRQLQQRITLSWTLTPLSRKETREYIRHRVNIASKKTGDRFSEPAYRMIYNYSRGIPRLINIACDRAFLTAFGFNARKVTGPIAKNALKELKNRGGQTTALGIFTPARLLAGAMTLVCIFLLAMFGFRGGSGSPAPPTAAPPPTPAPTVPVKQPAPSPAATAAIPGNATLQSLLNRANPGTSRRTALEALFALWKTNPTLDPQLHDLQEDSAFFQLAAAQNNFELLKIENDIGLIAKLNLPAVLGLSPTPGARPLYLLVSRLTDGHMVLENAGTGEKVRAKPHQLMPYWTGKVFVPWKNFFNCRGDITADAPGESIFTLKMMLRDIGFAGVPLDTQYDAAARGAVTQIQQKHGIRVDGIAGVQTKIVIYNERKGPEIPHLRPLSSAGSPAPGTEKNQPR